MFLIDSSTCTFWRFALNYYCTLQSPRDGDWREIDYSNNTVRAIMTNNLLFSWMNRRNYLSSLIIIVSEIYLTKAAYKQVVLYIISQSQINNDISETVASGPSRMGGGGGVAVNEFHSKYVRGFSCRCLPHCLSIESSIWPYLYIAKNTDLSFISSDQSSILRHTTLCRLKYIYVNIILFSWIRNKFGFIWKYRFAIDLLHTQSHMHADYY